MQVKVHKLGGNGEPSWALKIHEAAKEELLDLDDEEYQRVDEHLASLAHDPLRPRPGMDITKLKDLKEGRLYRLRVGDHRAVYAVITADRVVMVLVVEDREVGYKRMIARATARLRE